MDREKITNAILYWEKLRIVYNILLAGIVVFNISTGAMGLPVTSFLVSVLFLLAVAANVLYCAAYIPEIIIQYSDFYIQWKKCRLVLFIIGLITAGILTYIFTGGRF